MPLARLEGLCHQQVVRRNGRRGGAIHDPRCMFLHRAPACLLFSTLRDYRGEILSLVGDGFLSVFRCARNRRDSAEACRKALAGAVEAPGRMAEVNAARRTRGEAPLEFGLGLHVGNVMYGNVGLVDRLSFSAFGAAVNEAVRLQDLAKTCRTPIVASADFVDYAGGDWDALGETELRGFEHPVAVFRPRDGARHGDKVVRRDRSVGLSDAEAIVLLQRDGIPR